MAKRPPEIQKKHKATSTDNRILEIYPTCGDVKIHLSTLKVDVSLLWAYVTNVVSKSAYIYSQQYFAAPSSYLHLPLPWGSYFYIQINIFHNILFERSMYCCSDLSYLLPVIGQLELMSSANHRQQTALVAATVHIMSLKQQMLCFCFTKC